MRDKMIPFILKRKEKTYQFILKHKTKCLCFMCRAKMRYIAFRIKIDGFYAWLYSVKWINVEFWGSDYSDFREYEVISRQRVRMPDGKVRWPKTKYNHIKSVEVTRATE